MFANKYIDKQIRYECEIYSDITTLRRVVNFLILALKMVSFGAFWVF